jgi:hypothetical protein
LSGLAKELQLDKNSAHHRVRKATSAGYLANLEHRRGKPAQIVLAEPLPEEGDILPAPGAVEAWAEYTLVASTPPDSFQHSNTSQKAEPDQGDVGVGATVGGGVVLDPTVAVLEDAESSSNTSLQQPNPLFSKDLSGTVGVLEPIQGGHPLKEGDRSADDPDRSRVKVREVWPPALGPEGDDVFDIGQRPGWGQWN